MTPTIRPTSCASARRTAGPSGASSGRRSARRESPDAYTTPALLRYGTTVEIVITGGDVVTGHDPNNGRELWRANGLNPRQRRQPAHRRLARGPRRHDLRAVARAADAGAQAGRPRRRHQVARALDVHERTGRADAGHRRHVPVLDQRSRHHVVPGCEDRQAGLRPPAAAHRPPTAARRCWPTARSTSPTKTA